MSADHVHLVGGRPVSDILWEQRALASNNPAWIAQCSGAVIEAWVRRPREPDPPPETREQALARLERERDHWTSLLDNPHWGEHAQPHIDTALREMERLLCPTE